MHTGAMQGHSTVKRQTLNSTPSTYNDPFANLHSKLRCAKSYKNKCFLINFV